MRDLTDDGSASEDANEPVKYHEGSFDIVDGFRVLADFRCCFHGEVEAAHVSNTKPMSSSSTTEDGYQLLPGSLSGHV